MSYELSHLVIAARNVRPGKGAGDPHGLSRTQRNIALAFSVFCDPEGTAWPSVATLAQGTGTSERTVRNALRELENKGVLEVMSHPSGGRSPHGGITTKRRMIAEALREMVDTDEGAPRNKPEASCRVNPATENTYPATGDTYPATGRILPGNLIADKSHRKPKNNGALARRKLHSNEGYGELAQLLGDVPWWAKGSSWLTRSQVRELASLPGLTRTHVHAALEDLRRRMQGKSPPERPAGLLVNDLRDRKESGWDLTIGERADALEYAKRVERMRAGTVESESSATPSPARRRGLQITEDDRAELEAGIANGSPMVRRQAARMLEELDKQGVPA